MGLGLQARRDGASVVWRSSGGAVLLLGNAANCAAAIEDGCLTGFPVSDVVCVANFRTARQLEVLRSRHQGVPVQRPPDPLGWATSAAQVTRPAGWRVLRMRDWLQPDEELDLEEELQEHLAALRAAVACAGDAGLATAASPSSAPSAVAAASPRAVLVHCDLGHNRSPTLVLAFLVSLGYSLREAYRQVLRARPSVDPLPPYRRGLRKLEVSLTGVSTVNPEEQFALHVSELMGLIHPGSPRSRSRSRGSTSSGTAEIPSSSCSDEDSCDSSSGRCSLAIAMEQALALREASIEALLAEPNG